MMQLWRNVHLLDSHHNAHVARGYRFETNHAFYPMHPWLMQFIASLIGAGDLIWVGLVVELLESMANTVLIYRVGALAFKDR